MNIRRRFSAKPMVQDGTPAPEPAPLAPGQMKFYDNCIPSVEMGNYLINVAHHINPKSNAVIDEWHVASQLFSVQGPRYTLPTEDIFSTFPAAQSQGLFDQSLPNVVLTKRDLPWECNIFKDDEKTQSPWLALLLFVDQEQIGGGPALLPPQVDNWIRNETWTATLPASAFTNPANRNDAKIRWPNLAAEWYEPTDDNTPCAFIDISPAAFNALLPCKNDLRYLAHARQVDASAKDAQVLKISGDGWYSVVVGNRLPDPPPAGQPALRNIVHLVSLEGFADCFDRASGNPTAPPGGSRIRMISFLSWTFQCLPELGQSFSELMNNLVAEIDNSTKPATRKTRDLRLILPAPPLPAAPGAAQTYAWNAMQNGYSPVSYRTRQGEQTFAWYRGPFTPMPVDNFMSKTQQTAADPNTWTPYDTASSAINYDNKRGLFDLSYAIAWETGRLLALADGLFGQKLFDWQRKGHRLIDLLLERKSQMAVLKSFDPENPDPTIETDVLQGIEKYAITGDFMKYMITQFSAQIAPAIAGAPAPAGAPGFPVFANEPSPVPNPQSIANLLTQPDIQDAIREVGGQELETLADWLAQRYLLMGVPFENLLPNASLLPAESLRFFYLDSNWLDSLIEGAMSIGIESSRDRLYQDLMKDLIWDTTFQAVRQLRDNLLSSLTGVQRPAPSAPLDQESLTGMLLRSAAVPGYPGMQINAYAGTLAASAKPDTDTLIPLLRSERLSKDVLLCLWPTVPAVVCIEQPHEGVSFGFEEPTDIGDQGNFLYLRSLDAANYGAPVCSEEDRERGKCLAQIDGSTVIDSLRVLNISRAGGLLAQMRTLLKQDTPLAVRDFSLQMIKVPEQAVIATNPSHAEKSARP
jgi:hypothetical protein